MAKPEKDRKLKIIEAAVKLFAKEGAAFTKLSEVAKSAKVPAPLIHYYYKEPEDLHYDVILYVLESLKEYNLRGTQNTSNDPVSTLRAYLKGPLIWAKENPEYFGIWMYFYYMASRSERFEALQTQIRIGGRERIGLMLYQGFEKDVFKNPNRRPVSEIAREVQTQITGQAVMFGCEKRDRPIESFISDLEQSVFQMLGVTLSSKR